MYHSLCCHFLQLSSVDKAFFTLPKLHTFSSRCYLRKISQGKELNCTVVVVIIWSSQPENQLRWFLHWAHLLWSESECDFSWLLFTAPVFFFSPHVWIKHLTSSLNLLQLVTGSVLQCTVKGLWSICICWPWIWKTLPMRCCLQHLVGILFFLGSKCQKSKYL